MVYLAASIVISYYILRLLSVYLHGVIYCLFRVVSYTCLYASCIFDMICISEGKE